MKEPKGSAATGLRELLDRESIVVAPGIYDCVSARVVEKAGFKTGYLTGHGLSNSTIGESDVGLLSFGEVSTRAFDIVGSVDMPVIVDTDTGYGGPINVQRTVREMERIGAAAIQLEDQTWPKKCGHMVGKSVIAEKEMVQKLRAATDARSGDLVIIARTDALAVEGLDRAIERCRSYYEAGADVVFIDALGDEEECRRAAEELKVPLLANMVEGGRTAYLSISQLQEIGFAIVIFPISLLLSAITAMNRAAKELQEHGQLSQELTQSTMSFPEFLDFWDFPVIQDAEARYACD